MEVKRAEQKNGLVFCLKSARQFRLSDQDNLRCRIATSRRGTDALSGDKFPEKCCFLPDYYLDEMNGIELLSRLRSAGYAQPALIMTPHASRRILEQASNAGVRVVETFHGSELFRPPPSTAWI